MSLITDVKTQDWQMSATGFGVIAEGADDINQCLNFIFATQKGTDPLRPDFGLDLLSYIDKPANIVAPQLTNEIADQVASYETRIDLNTINYRIGDSGLLFAMTWSYASGTSLPASGGLPNTVYFLLSDERGFILLNDYDVSLILN